MCIKLPIELNSIDKRFFISLDRLYLLKNYFFINFENNFNDQTCYHVCIASKCCEKCSLLGCENAAKFYVGALSLETIKKHFMEICS